MFEHAKCKAVSLSSFRVSLLQVLHATAFQSNMVIATPSCPALHAKSRGVLPCVDTALQATRAPAWCSKLRTTSQYPFSHATCRAVSPTPFVRQGSMYNHGLVCVMQIAGVAHADQFVF